MGDITLLRGGDSERVRRMLRVGDSSVCVPACTVIVVEAAVGAGCGGTGGKAGVVFGGIATPPGGGKLAFTTGASLYGTGIRRAPGAHAARTAAASMRQAGWRCNV